MDGYAQNSLQVPFHGGSPIESFVIINNQSGVRITELLVLRLVALY